MKKYLVFYLLSLITIVFIVIIIIIIIIIIITIIIIIIIIIIYIICIIIINIKISCITTIIIITMVIIFFYRLNAPCVLFGFIPLPVGHNGLLWHTSWRPKCQVWPRLPHLIRVIVEDRICTQGIIDDVNTDEKSPADHR